MSFETNLMRSVVSINNWIGIYVTVLIQRWIIGFDR